MSLITELEKYSISCGATGVSGPYKNLLGWSPAVSSQSVPVCRQ